MANEILAWVDILQREKISLQKGMNFRIGGDYSIILRSRHVNAPYRDAIDQQGHLIYEWHDVQRTNGVDPKLEDQPMYTKNGKLTENGKFFMPQPHMRMLVDCLNVYRCMKDSQGDMVGQRTDGAYRLLDGR